MRIPDAVGAFCISGGALRVCLWRCVCLLEDGFGRLFHGTDFPRWKIIPIWNLSGRKWKEAWADHPRGFVEEWTEQDREQLEALNESRSAVVNLYPGLPRVARRPTAKRWRWRCTACWRTSRRRNI
ncbi:MAG: hypothetical protein ACLS8R_00635 [Anaeromassilibacillus sp.]